MTGPNLRPTPIGLRRALPILLTFLTIAALSSGCSTRVPGLSLIAPTANPDEEISLLEAEVRTARENQLDVLSPTWFEVADESADRARKGLTNGEAVKTILADVAKGRAALEQARTFGEVSRQTLPSVIQAREDARAAGAPALGDEYDRVERKFVELTAGVESDSMSWARRTAPDVEQAFRSVELSSIKRNTVDRIVDLIAKAKEAGAARYAPAALEDVEKRYKALDKFISKNRYATEAMGERSNEVLFYANRVVYLTEEAKRVEDLRPNELALQREALLASLGQKLELPDLRNQSQASQRRQIENAIDNLLDTRHELGARVDTLSNELEKQRGRLSELRGEAEQERMRLAALEDERRFNQRFTEVSALFQPGEAQVYKKGTQLVIRLRSIDFPVGSAEVLPKSYPVLAKVQRAIKSFDQPRVVVEGHTDSTGSAEVNDRLSQARADAILSYLVNNATIEAGRISAVGKGFSEPLASDRTAEGRAQNRRIDVIIDAGANGQLAQNDLANQ